MTTLALSVCPKDGFVIAKVLSPESNYRDTVGTLVGPISRPLFQLCAKQYITKATFDMVIGEIKHTFDLTDTLIHDNLYSWFERHLPEIIVTTDLDWLTFIGYAKLAFANHLRIEKDQVDRFKKSHKPTSKKEVLQSWDYQG